MLDSHVSKEFVSMGLEVLCIGTDKASDSPLSMAPTSNDCEDKNPGEHTMHVAFTQSNNHVNLVPPPEWPAKMNLHINSSGKLKLMDQSHLIQDVITESFTFLCASIILVHVFPDPTLTGTFMMRALVSATSKDMNAVSICHQILNAHAYLAKIMALVCCSSP